jgi:hypothetical protein
VRLKIAIASGTIYWDRKLPFSLDWRLSPLFIVYQQLFHSPQLPVILPISPFFVLFAVDSFGLLNYVMALWKYP